MSDPINKEERKRRREEGVRTKFRATVERFGSRRILVRHVLFADTGKWATDHVWFVVGKRIKKLKPGDIVTFDARISAYEKLKKDAEEMERQSLEYIDERETDYKLNNPTRLAKERHPPYDPRHPDMPPLINDVVLTEEGRRLWNAEAEEVRRIRERQAKEAVARKEGQ